MTRLALAVLAACGAPPPPAALLSGQAPPPVEHRYVVKMGPAQIGNIEERITGTPAQYFHNAKVPALSPVASCGMGLYVGGSEVAWCMDGTRFIYDENDSTDLADDPAHDVVVQSATQSMVTIPGRFRLVAEHVVTKVRTFDVFYLYAETTRHGILDIDGRQLDVIITGTFGRFDHPPKGHDALDVRGYWVRGDHVEIFDHRRLQFSVAHDGARVTFVEAPR